MLDQTNVPSLSAQGKCSHLVNLYVLLPGRKSGCISQGKVPLGPVLMAMSLSSWWMRLGSCGSA